MARLSRWLILTLLMGCATANRGGDAPSTLPKQMQARQIIITLSDATPERWAALATELSTDYQLREAGSFPLSSIRVFLSRPTY